MDETTINQILNEIGKIGEHATLRSSWKTGCAVTIHRHTIERPILARLLSLADETGQDLELTAGPNGYFTAMFFTER